MTSRKTGFRSFFDTPNLALEQALGAAIAMFKNFDLDPDHYTVNPGHGSRRKKRQIEQVYSSAQILEEISNDTFTEGIGPGFMVKAIRGKNTQNLHVSPPFERFPFQDFGISGTSGLDAPHFHELIKVISKFGNLALAGAYEGNYMAWQRCDDREWYLKKYGPITGFPVITREFEPPRQPLTLLDISKNPGRISSVNTMPVSVEADMWLGPAFWKYAPCTKEDVLKETWVEVEDTEHYLYLKAYPEPFTRPDGEQGRIQRRIWNVLFHQDCEWPPGSGTIADS